MKATAFLLLLSLAAVSTAEPLDLSFDDKQSLGSNAVIGIESYAFPAVASSVEDSANAEAILNARARLELASGSQESSYSPSSNSGKKTHEFTTLPVSTLPVPLPKFELSNDEETDGSVLDLDDADDIDAVTEEDVRELMDEDEGDDGILDTSRRLLRSRRRVSRRPAKAKAAAKRKAAQAKAAAKRKAAQAKAAAKRKAAAAKRKAAKAKAAAKRKAATAKRKAAKAKAAAKRKAAKAKAAAKRRAAKAKAAAKRKASRAKARAAARLRASKAQRNFPIKMTVDNQFTLFVDGKKIGRGNSWTTTYSFNPKIKNPRVVAVEGVDVGGPAAMIGVFNGKPTRASEWRCKQFTGSMPKQWIDPDYDDSKWRRASSYGRNNQNNIWFRVARGSRRGIPANAEYLWTENNDNHNKVVCRWNVNGDAAQRNRLKRLEKRSGYDSISRLLVSMEKEINKDMNTAGNIDSKARSSLSSYQTKVKRVKDAIRRTRNQLENAKRTNEKYNKDFNKSHGEHRTLLASLKRQRKFIKVEHDYINKMEKEALSLKKTSSQYKAIHNEILQMRARVKREVSDVEAAYQRAMRNAANRKNRLSRRRTSTAVRIKHLNALMSKYNAQHTQFQKLITGIHKREGINAFGIKALGKLHDAVAEFQTHVRHIVKKNISLNYRSGYKQCAKEYAQIQRFYKRAKCHKTKK